MKNYKQTDLFQDDEALTLSVEDTRVSRFPLQDVKEAKTIQDISGRNILDSLENSVRITRLERTWADIFDSVWIPYSKIWTARTTPSGALVLKQRVSVPRTAGNGSGLLPSTRSILFKIVIDFAYVLFPVRKSTNCSESISSRITTLALVYP